MTRWTTPPLGRRAWRALLLMAAVGLVGRLVIAFTTHGVRPDMAAYVAVLHALQHDPLHVYSTVNAQQSLPGLFVFRWPYPPGFFPWVLAAGRLSSLTGLAINGWLKLPAVLADVATALLVQDFLGSRGASDRRRLLAAALTLFGPSFVVISALHGQFDSFAILPALLATMLWVSSPSPSPSRGLVAGLLIGLGALLKTVPGFIALALLPTARGWRERALLIAASLAAPALALAPFLAADPAGVINIRRYASLPGFGGPALLLQPSFARVWLQGASVPLDGGTLWLITHGSSITLAALVALTAWMCARRTPPLVAAMLVWLTVYAFGPGFAFQYACWVLPFMLAANHLRAAAALQALLLVPMFILYAHVNLAAGTVVYVGVMALAWGAFVVVLLVMLRSSMTRPREATLA